MSSPQHEPNTPQKGTAPGDDALVALLKSTTINRQTTQESSSTRQELAFTQVETSATRLFADILTANHGNPLVVALREYVATLPEKGKHFELLSPKGNADAELTVPEDFGPLCITPEGLMIKIGPKAFSITEKAQFYAETAGVAVASTFWGSVVPNVERYVGPLSAFGYTPQVAKTASEQKAPEYVFRTPTIVDLRLFPYTFEQVMDAARKVSDGI